MHCGDLHVNVFTRTRLLLHSTHSLGAFAPPHTPCFPSLSSLVHFYRNKSSFFISLHRLIDLWTEEICQEE